MRRPPYSSGFLSTIRCKREALRVPHAGLFFGDGRRGNLGQLDFLGSNRCRECAYLEGFKETPRHARKVSGHFGNDAREKRQGHQLRRPIWLPALECPRIDRSGLPALSSFSTSPLGLWRVESKYRAQHPARGTPERCLCIGLLWVSQFTSRSLALSPQIG
jgi:hypothetical protein